MYKKIAIFIKHSFKTLVVILSAWSNLTACQDFKESSEEELYKRGLEYRNAGNTSMAIDCFLPLAEKGYPRAQHNLAMKYIDLHDEYQAYVWFRCASNQNFQPSTNNLGRMNLFDILLPDEIISHITSFLTLKDLSSFRLVSHRAQRIANSQILLTDFLNSETAYARDLRSLFSTVIFEPRPQAIRVARFAKVKNSSIEVHFRNSSHLRDIIETTPLIVPGPFDQVYFIRDENAKDGKELLTLGEELEQGYFIKIISDQPIKLSGVLKLSGEMLFPKKTDLSYLNYAGIGERFGELPSYDDANQLARMIDSFKEELFTIRTSEAYELIESRRHKRRTSPEIFPDFADVCNENLLILSGSDLKVLPKDYIQSNESFIYIANSISTLKELRKKIPSLSCSISYVDYEVGTPGVYSEGPLSLVDGFKVSTATHLMINGRMFLPGYNINLKAKEAIWSFGSSYKCRTLVISTKECCFAPLIRPLAANIKPERMPNEEWERFLTACRGNIF